MLQKITLEDLGFHPGLDQFKKDHQLDSLETGRIIAEHKERYTVRTEKGDYEAEITGHMRFTAASREDFPAVGDWVALAIHEPDFAVIHQILPRYSIIRRKAVGQSAMTQIIGTNIDYAFLVQAADRDFNINRLERYLTICHASGVSPVIILSKTDLIDDKTLNELIANIKKRITGVPVLAVSNKTGKGFEAVRHMIERGKTYCMLGSSGVGKSTLINHLSGKDIMKTETISESTQKGRHTTSHRELILLENGGILIDNPGMREVGIADMDTGLKSTFDNILSLSSLCKFKDCKHISETGCAVLEAVDTGKIDRNSYENYLRLEREKSHFETTYQEKRKRDKQMGKMFKNFKKDMKRGENNE